MGAFAQQPLGGFLYGTEAEPKGTEWEAPEKLSLNKEQPRAYFFSFADVESARRVQPEASSYWQSLNGTWKFQLCNSGRNFQWRRQLYSGGRCKLCGQKVAGLEFVVTYREPG